MTRLPRSLLRLCLAGSALASASLFAPVAQAAIFTKADVVSPAAAKEPVHFDVYLPLQHADQLDALLDQMQRPGSPQYHKWLTPAQFGAQFGPSRATIAAAAKELAAQGFTVKAQTRSLHVTGTADMVARAFATTLSHVKEANGAIRTVSIDGLKLTPALAEAGALIPTFDARRTTTHVLSHNLGRVVHPNDRYSPDGPYFYNDLKQAYSYPAYNATTTTPDGTQVLYNGTGANIAALMSSDENDADLAVVYYHEHYRETENNKPILFPTHVYVSGATPGLHTDAYDEVELDIQQESTGAPGAAVTLYDIPDLSDGSTTAGYTTIDEDNAIDVVSSSFGECELFYTPAYNGGVDYTYVPKIQHELYLQGNAQGITFLASSGDSSGVGCPDVNYFAGGPSKFVAGVEVPAADPAVTAVGGTNLVTGYTAGSLDSPYVGENAWSDPEIAYDPYGIGVNVKGGRWGAGGGISTIFGMPAYQSQLHPPKGIKGRMVPDIGMQVGGCPGGISKYDPCNGGDKAKDGNGNTDRSYVLVAIDGLLYGLIGTSVSSPEFAGALATLVQHTGRVGNINPYIYAQALAQQKTGPSQFDVYHIGIPGYNGVKPNFYPLADLYNFTTGVGTPIVSSFVGAPQGTPVAGTPRTPTNP